VAKRLPQEDSYSLENAVKEETSGQIKIVVPKLAHISNYDDFDPLIAEPDVGLEFIDRGEMLPENADLVILPGSKTTIGDLIDLRKQGWDIDIKAHLRRGGSVYGICAGYQMLGQWIKDPKMLEGELTSIQGLGLLDVQTILGGDKTLKEVAAVSSFGFGEFDGYEMHIGRTVGPDCQKPFGKIGNRNTGAVSPDGKVSGCYIHGLFANDVFRHAMLSSIKHREATGVSYDLKVEEALDRVSLVIEESLDVDRLLALAR
jgi:adenosylcobyric acid synthase